MIRLQADYAPVVRTFLIGAGQNVTNVLSREIMLAGGLADPDHPVKSITLMGRVDDVDKDLLAQRSGLDIRVEEPIKEIVRAMADDSDMACHELMIAYGAALAGKTRGHKTDFRRDFMPYQGRRKILEGSLRLIGISLTVLLVTVAMFFQLKTFRMKSYTRSLYKKIRTEHQKIGLRPKDDRPLNSRYSTLAMAINNAKRAKEGMGPGDDKSVPAKLTFFFEALNQTDKKVNIEIQKVTITERSMKVKGTTNSRSGTMALFDQIKKHPRIVLSSERVAAGPDRRDVFDITIEPKQSKARR